MHRAAIVAGQITGNLDTLAVRAVAIQRGVIQLGIVIDFDTGAAIRGAVDCTAGDRAVEFHPVAFIRVAINGGIAVIHQRASDIDTGAVGGIPG
ncbi:Uncharacterised protein [Yersinia kristensenii]|uniref:Uncharacterized protein n=1 Tax=Yersinia kristensenii TaxID=28152 RepID=A0A0T9M6F8_YERKR|nr:Uncharacterised protein [Yersinia kristensenii]